MARRYLPKNIEELVRWYTRYVSPVSLVVGFLLDNFFLLRDVDALQTYVVIGAHLIFAATCIVLLHMVETGRFRSKMMVKAAPFFPVAAQFSFGGLFSGFLSLYARSAALPATWIFVFILAALLIGNEQIGHLYKRLSFQIGVYFTLLFLFFIFFLPVVTHQIGTLMFVASGVASLVAIALFLYLIALLAPAALAPERWYAIRAIAVIFVLINGLYFLNLIPPLPLSLKDAGVYHFVSRDGDGSYDVQGETVPWYDDLSGYNKIFHRGPGEVAYVYTSVFAPTDLSFTLEHQWQYWDPSTDKWTTEATISFPVQGGRDGGYRGYSEKTDLAAGDWRVNVLTQYGEVIGRVSFTVVDASSSPPLVESTL